MKLSVIIPMYNAERYISQCLKSVLACERPDMEIIVVDDGSHDQSLKKCQEQSQKDARVHVISQENKGVSVARNTGMKAAAGDYLMFLDADDYMKAAWWNIIFAAMEKRADFYAFSYDSLFPDGSSREEPFPKDFEGSSMETACRILLSTPLFHTCWGKLFRRDLILQNQLIFTSGMKIGEDYLFVLEYFKHVSRVWITNTSVMYYRQNEAGAMGSFQFQVRLDNVVVVWKYCKEYVKQEKMRPFEMGMKEYQFSAFAYFVRMMVRANSVTEAVRLLKITLNHKDVQDLLKNVPAGQLRGNKKAEYFMLSRKIYLPTVWYYKLKQRIMEH